MRSLLPGNAVLVLGLAACAAASGCVTVAETLPGFVRSRHFDEQVKLYSFDPDVSVHINAPSAAAYDRSKPTQVVLYALPNGNTTAQTIGRRRAPDIDWHFFIQHIGAQTRRLREVVSTENIVVAYVEAGGRSWPSWRHKHDDSSRRIAELVDSIRSHFTGDTTVTLAGHSGGGSMIFGFINHADEIPDWVTRIIFLDANYAYDDKQQHGDKLIRWLRRSSRHCLCVVAYDDRNVRFNGKLLVGPTGGTYRKTQRMLERLGRDVPLAESRQARLECHVGLDGRINITRIDNPDLKILHTVMVERNGFIHGMTHATPYEGKAGMLWEPSAYEQWIQADENTP